jgi:predicted RNA-binding protein
MFSSVFSKRRLANGDILLVREKIPMDEYKCQLYVNGDVLLSKVDVIMVSGDDISEYDFIDSFIMRVSLNGVEIRNTHYFYNYKVFLNYLTHENVNDNFNHNTYIDYIVSHCKENKLSLNMKIRLSDRNVANIVLK